MWLQCSRRGSGGGKQVQETAWGKSAATSTGGPMGRIRDFILRYGRVLGIMSRRLTCEQFHLLRSLHNLRWSWQEGQNENGSGKSRTRDSLVVIVRTSTQ